MMGWSPRCYISSFVEIGPPVQEKKILEGFYHIWAWRPSRLCDQDPMNKLSFLLPKEAQHKISTEGQAVLEKNVFEIVDDGRTPEHMGM